MKVKRFLSAVMASIMLFALCGYFPNKKGISDLPLTANAANVENIVARADYLYGIKWTPLKTIYRYGKDGKFEAGKSYRLPYGMPVNTGTFIGYDISIDNFIKETKNSSSKLYTSSSGWNNSSYSNAWYCPYYSMDCSTFVSWCWGLSSRNTTSGLNNHGKSLGACSSKSNISKIQVGDALNSSGHVGLVTGISNGKYEITEMTPTVLQRETFTASELLSSKWNGYDILRPTDFKTNTVKINYHTNGGTIGNDEYYAKDGKIYNSEDKVVGEKWEYGKGDTTGLYNASTFKLTKKGYTFTGWSPSKSGGKVFDQDDTSLTANDIFPDIATKSGTVVLYAQWEKNLLTMNYNTNGGQISENETYYAVSGGNIYRKSDSKIFSVKWGYDYVAEKGLYNASTFNLIRPGYKFKGWSLSKTGGTVYDQSDNTIRAATLFPDIYTKSGKVMLYAQWEKNTVTINYNTNGGTIETNDAYYAKDGKIYNADGTLRVQKWGYNSGGKDGLINASSFKLSKSGYNFLGWSTSKSGGKIYDQNDTTLTANDIYPDIATKSGTITMYAQWKAVATTTTTQKTTTTTKKTTTTAKTTTKPTTTTTRKITTTTTTKITTTITTTATSTTTSTNPSAPTASVGDTNCDGQVYLNDAVLILQYLGNPDAYPLSDEAKANADVSGNGDGITNKDALAIQRFILHLIPSLPESS